MAINPITGRDDGATTNTDAQNGLVNSFLNLGDSTGMANNAGLATGLLTAANQYRQAGKYVDLGKQAASMASPVTTDDRRYYIDQLNKSYTDPQAFLSDPGHQATQKFGLDSLSRQDAMKGYLGSGNMATDLGKYINQSDNTFLDQERARLGNLGGFQFDPASGASMLMKGGELGMQSENAGLGALMAPFLAQQGTNQMNTTAGKTPNYNPSQVASAFKGLTSPQDIASQLMKVAGGMGGSVQQLWNYLMSNPNVDPSTASVIQSMQSNPQFQDWMKGTETFGGETPGSMQVQPDGSSTNPFTSIYGGGPSSPLDGFQTPTSFNNVGSSFTPDVGSELPAWSAPELSVPDSGIDFSGLFGG